MKYGLVALVLLAAFFIWRHNRRKRLRELQKQQQAHREATARAHQLAQPAAMTRCLHCGLHLPLSEAIEGKRGHYCGQEHRQHAEG